MNVQGKIIAPVTPERPDTVRHYLSTHMRDYAMGLALLAIILFFGFATDGVLLTPLNITNVISQNSYIVIMALGMLLVIVAGHIDLSVGSIVAYVGAVAAIMMSDHHIDYRVTILASLALGALIGAWNGVFIAYFKIPSFIVTLATMLVFRGLSIWQLDGRSVGSYPEGYLNMASGFVPDYFSGFIKEGLSFNGFSVFLGVITSIVVVAFSYKRRTQEKRYGFVEEPDVVFIARNVVTSVVIVALCWSLASYKGLPDVLIIMTMLVVLYIFITTRTTLGRRIYAIGGNEKAARLSGIKTERLTFLTFVNMGILAALAGMIYAARLTTATPKAGQGVELDVIAACFIGGASASGGVGKVIGAVIGALVMGVMNNGMSMIGLGIDMQMIIKGLVLLAAVFFDVYNKTKG